MDMSFTWKCSTAAALALQLTRAEKISKATVNWRLVVKAVVNPLELVAKKAAVRMR